MIGLAETEGEVKAKEGMERWFCVQNLYYHKCSLFVCLFVSSSPSSVFKIEVLWHFSGWPSNVLLKSPAMERC